MRVFFFLLLISAFLQARDAAFPASRASRNIYYARIAVENEQQIVKLAARGYEFADARVLPNSIRGEMNYSVRWLAENRSTTIISLDERINREKLESLGVRIIEEGVQQKTIYPHLPAENIPLQFGWPRTMNGWPAIYGQATTIDDMNNDGTLEIFLSNIEGHAYMWQPNGTFVLGFPVPPDVTGWSTGSRETAAAGDINGDGLKECIFGRWIGRLYAFQYNSTQVSGFPLTLGPILATNDPALYDFDGDGKEEMVIYAYPDQQTYAPGIIHIYNEDFSELPGWPQQLPVFSESSPAIGDIDGDNEMEIVVGSGQDNNTGVPGRLYAFNLDGSICSGFPIETGYAVNCTPTIYDIDLNEVGDILIRVKLQSTEVNGIYAFDGSGNILPGFPAELTSGHPNGAPAVADVNGDGLPEIAYGSVQAIDSGKVWLFSNSGVLMPGFPQPVYATWVEESVSLEDVSGDSLPDIVCGTNGLGSDPAHLWAFDYRGQVVSGFPITINETFSTLETTPTIIDIDDDGDTEIFTASHEGTVWVYDTPGVPASSSWPTLKYNAARLGSIPRQLTGISPPSTTAPGKMELYQNYPNPFNPQTRISFFLPRPQFVILTVFDGLGRPVVEVINNEFFEAGRHVVNFQAHNLPSGIYYYQLRAGTQKQLRKMLLVK